MTNEPAAPPPNWTWDVHPQSGPADSEEIYQKDDFMMFWKSISDADRISYLNENPIRGRFAGEWPGRLFVILLMDKQEVSAQLQEILLPPSKW